MTVREAAAQLHISTRSVQMFIAEGKLRAVRHGRDWWIEPEELKFVAVRRKAGRPKQTFPILGYRPVNRF